MKPTQAAEGQSSPMKYIFNYNNVFYSFFYDGSSACTHRSAEYAMNYVYSGEMVLDKTVGEWQEFTIRLDYNNLDIRPTHIVVVCTSSRYGDYFTGSRQSVLFVDDLELYYDKLEQ